MSCLFLFLVSALFHQEYQPLVLIIEVLYFNFHLIDFGGFGVSLEFHDGLVLELNFGVQLFNYLFKADYHREVLYLYAVLVDQALHLEGFLHFVCYGWIYYCVGLVFMGCYGCLLVVVRLIEDISDFYELYYSAEWS